MIITGSIEEIRFVNSENGYHIVVLKSGGETFVATGSFPPIAEGETLRLSGEFVMHERFGRQFKSESAERIEPTGAEAVSKFLSGGLFKGIGPKTAEAITKVFGAKSLEIMENQPHLLSKIRGISPQKAQSLAEEYKKHVSAQNTVMFLLGVGLGLNLSLKIFKEYGGDAKAVVSANPYKLIEDIDGVGFATADRIARTLGIQIDALFRLKAGVICTLKDSADKGGNTFLLRDELVIEAARLLGLKGGSIESGGTGESNEDGNGGKTDGLGADTTISRQNETASCGILDAAIDELIILNKLKSVIIDNKQALFLHFAYASEYGSAGKIVALQNNFNKQTDRGQIEKDLDEYRRIYGIELNDEQKNAVVSSMQNAVSVITGGPGTGKTTIIKCLIFLFNKRGESFNLMAPTGRAAKRINESTGEEAATIHRALKLTPGQSEQSSIQVGADNVIVDEVSMLDIFLFYSLLKCVRDGTRLILLGDSDQLPSVGAGNVLADLLQKLPKVCLTKIYRQDGGSLIIENAHKINGGQMPNLKSTDKDFFFIKRNKGIEVADEIVRLVSKRLPKYLGVTPDKIQVLCPMKNGPAGANNLNALLSAVLNPLNRPVIISGSTSFKEGDKVMQTSNNYSLEYQRGSEHGEGVFNGDMGVIESLDVATKELTVLFEDGKRAAYTDSIGELVLSYAITVHKSQGSEFEAVILPAILGSPLILTRNLLYTAITRARRLVVLVGEEYAVKRMVDNDYIARRNSGLSFFLEAAGKNYLRLFGEKG